MTDSTQPSSSGASLVPYKARWVPGISEKKLKLLDPQGVVLYIKTDPDDVDTESMEIDENDDPIFQTRLLPPTFDEVLLSSSSDPDVILPPFFSGTLAEAVNVPLSSDFSRDGG